MCVRRRLPSSKEVFSPALERQRLDEKIMNCSSSGSHSVDSEPRRLILHNPRGLSSTEICLMSAADSKSGFLVNAPPPKPMGEVQKKTWGQLAAEWTVEEKKEKIGGGSWQASIEIWQDKTYRRIYETINRQVGEQYQKSWHENPVWTGSQEEEKDRPEARWKKFIRQEQRADKTRSQEIGREFEGRHEEPSEDPTQLTSPTTSRDSGEQPSRTI